MDKSYLDVIKELENYKNATAYTSLLNYFKIINFAFPFCDIEKQIFYRVRIHKNEECFFYYESELSYISNSLLIKDFSRCNEPLQSMFYCSDNIELSKEEVFKTLDRKSLGFRYYTISKWEQKEKIRTAYFLESDFTENVNHSMLDMKNAFDEIINDDALIGNKHELKEFLIEIFKQFKRPFSINDKAYYLSSAVTNYLFYARGLKNEKIEGLIYPTCLSSEFNHLGLNYVFPPEIIGKGKKIEFIGACRIDTQNDDSKVFCKGTDFTNGFLDW